jgi:hypothetical protein
LELLSSPPSSGKSCRKLVTADRTDQKKDIGMIRDSGFEAVSSV